MDWTKVKNNKILKWALIIGATSAIVLTYYGYKYIKKKVNEKNALSEGSEIKTDEVKIENNKQEDK